MNATSFAEACHIGVGVSAMICGFVRAQKDIARTMINCAHYVLAAMLPILIVYTNNANAIDSRKAEKYQVHILKEMRASYDNHKAVFNLQDFGWKVCISPDGTGYRAMLEHSFSKKVVDSINIDASDGYWYIAIQDKFDQGHVVVVGIPQSEMMWEVPEDTKLTDSIKCNAKVQVVLGKLGWSFTVHN